LPSCPFPRAWKLLLMNTVHVRTGKSGVACLSGLCLAFAERFAVSLGSPIAWESHRLGVPPCWSVVKAMGCYAAFLCMHQEPPQDPHTLRIQMVALL